MVNVPPGWYCPVVAVAVSAQPKKLYPSLVGFPVCNVKSLLWNLICCTGAPSPPFASYFTIYLRTVIFCENVFPAASVINISYVPSISTSNEKSLSVINFPNVEYVSAESTFLYCIVYFVTYFEHWIFVIVILYLVSSICS